MPVCGFWFLTLKVPPALLLASFLVRCEPGLRGSGPLLSCGCCLHFLRNASPGKLWEAVSAFLIEGGRLVTLVHVPHFNSLHGRLSQPHTSLVCVSPVKAGNSFLLFPTALWIWLVPFAESRWLQGITCWSPRSCCRNGMRSRGGGGGVNQTNALAYAHLDRCT